MQSVLTLIDTILWLYMVVIIIMVIMSWLLAFNVINSQNQFVRQVHYFTHRITEPIMGPIRRILPDLGGIDLSPLVVLLGIFFLRNLIQEYRFSL